MAQSVPPSSGSPDSFPEKRTFQRFELWFPVTLVVPGGGPREIWSICRDASAGGILVSSIAPLQPGTRVQARFRVARTGAPEHIVAAVIVRSTTSSGDLMLAFPFSLGLRFENPVANLLGELSDPPPEQMK